MGFNCLKAAEPLQVGSLLFTFNFPEIPGTHLIDPRRMKSNLGATQWFLNTGPLDWESQAFLGILRHISVTYQSCKIKPTFNGQPIFNQ